LVFIEKEEIEWIVSLRDPLRRWLRGREPIDEKVEDKLRRLEEKIKSDISAWKSILTHTEAPIDIAMYKYAIEYATEILDIISRIRR